MILGVECCVNYHKTTFVKIAMGHSKERELIQLYLCFLSFQASRVTTLRPRVTWPSHGNIIFTNYSTRYRPGLDLVVKNIDIHIRGREKVGAS